MKPEDEDYLNGDDGSGSDSSSGSGGGCAVLSALDAAWPARALAALDALRLSRQHYDVVLVAGGAELPAHRALLAAASPALLDVLAPPPPALAPPSLLLRHVPAPPLRALLHYLYSGRLRARTGHAARELYMAAWSLRVECARALLARRLTQHALQQQVAREPHALLARQLPDLEPELRDQLDTHIAHNFESMCATGGLTTLPGVRLELLRARDAAGGEGGARAGGTPSAVAAAALAWLRAQLEPGDVTLEEVCSRTHLLYVAAGALQDCGALPPAQGDAPELSEYRRAAERRAARPPRAVLHPAPPLPHATELGERALPPGDWAVLAAATAERDETRALLALGGRCVLVRVARRTLAERVEELAAGGEACGRLARGRAAHGAAALDGRLLVVGGYDRAEALSDAVSYDPATNTWASLAGLRGARARFPAARLGSRVYLLGGSDGQRELASVLCWDGAGWAGRAALPGAVSHAGAAADEARGELYLVGGWAAGQCLRAVHRYVAAADRWEAAPALLVGRSQAAAVWWEGALWALGGCSAWHCLASTERLAPGAPCWEVAPPLPTARRGLGAAAWRGRLVAAGGSDGAASLRRVDWLAAGGAEWSPAPGLQRARAGLSLSVLGDALYAVGGFSGKEFLPCVETLHAPDQPWTLLRDPPAPAALPAPPAPPTPPAPPAPEDTAPEAKQDDVSAAAIKLAAAITITEQPAPAENGQH